MQSSSSKSSEKKVGRKSGFRLKALPEDAYKGQQQKIKQALIQKAKLKKNYAKVLQQEARSSKDNAEYNRKEQAPVAAMQSRGHTSDEAPSPADDAKSEHESDDETSGQAESPKQDRVATQEKSYRQRVKARKQDPNATKTAIIRQDRTDERALLEARRLQVQQKRQHRTDVKKRETSRTKKGQPLMKDRMKNILNKLQSV